jgi:hypothetical protein
MWYFSNVFRRFPFFSVFMTFIVSVILSYICPVLSKCLEYTELPLLFLIACIRFLYLA